MDKNNEAAKQQPAKKTNKNKKPNIFVRMGRKIKEIFSELKKVTWPSLLVTVILVLAVIMLMDLGLQKLLELAQGKNASGALVKLFEVL